MYLFVRRETRQKRIGDDEEDFIANALCNRRVGAREGPPYCSGPIHLILDRVLFVFIGSAHNRLSVLA